MSNITKIVVVDTETTGLDPATDAVVEVAAVPIDRCSVERRPQSGLPCDELVWGTTDGEFSSLVWPGREIPPEASAVHHLTLTMLNPSCTLDVVTHGMVQAEEPGAMVYAAHNARFDSAFLPMLTLPWICTWRCAMHLWPEAPGHGNQVLRYWRGAEPVNAECAFLPRDTQPHSALYDARTTAALLLQMLETRTPEQLLVLSTQPVLLRTCRFGRHRGAAWADVPRGYLSWVLGQGPGGDGFDEDVRYTAEYWLARGRGLR